MNQLVAILGGGQFGLRALRWARKNGHRAIVFDSSAQAQVRNDIHAVIPAGQKWTPGDLTSVPSVLFVGDAVEVAMPVIQQLRPAIIIPTLPVHFLAVALLFIAEEQKYKYVPDVPEVMRIANALRGKVNVSEHPEAGILSMSYAQPGETCPPTCGGPKRHCPTFNREKPQTVTALVIAATQTNPNAYVVESQQLTRGLGGILDRDFFSIIDRFRAKNPSHFVVATTCNCHGVVHAFRANEM